MSKMDELIKQLAEEKAKEKKTAISVYLTSEQLNNLDATVERVGTSRTRVIAILVDMLVEE